MNKDIRHLVARLKSADWAARWDAAIALGDLPDSETTGPLVTCLTDPHYLVRLEAAKALGKMMWDPPDTATRAKYLAAQRDWPGLVEMGAVAVTPLAHLLGDTDEGIRRGVAESLTKLGQASVELLIDALDNNDPEMRRNAAGVLGEIGDERAIDPLVSALSDGDITVRRNAAMSLGRLGNEKAIEPLITILDNRRTGIQEAAMRALAQLGRAVVAPLVKSFLAGSQVALEVLVRIGPPSVESLTPLLKDKRVRNHIAEALGRIGDRRAMSALKAAIDPDDQEFNREVELAIKTIEEGIWSVPDD